MGNKSDRAKGGFKEALGKLGGHRQMKEQGRRDQAKGDVKAGAKKLKDALKKL